MSPIDEQDLNALRETILEAVDEASGEHEIPTIDERPPKRRDWLPICGFALAFVASLTSCVIYLTRVDERVRVVEDAQKKAVSQAQFEEFKSSMLRESAKTSEGVNLIGKQLIENAIKLDEIRGAIRGQRR